MFAFPTADPTAVRAHGNVPDRWNLRLDDQGRASLFIVAYACPSMTVAGVTRPALYANLAVAVDPVGAVDASRRTASFAGVEGFTDFYLISFVTDDLDFALWLKSGTGLEDRVRYVPDLTMDWPMATIADVEVEAPPPAQSPFRLTAAVTQPVAFLPEVTANFWADTKIGLVMLETSNPQGDLLGYGSWSLTTPPKSPLAEMMGGSDAAASCVTPVDCFPSDEASTVGLYRKDLP